MVNGFLKKVSIVLLLSSFIQVGAEDPFKKANALYDQSEWVKAEKEYDSIFKDIPMPEELNKEIIEKVAASHDMTSEELIRGHVNCGDVKMALMFGDAKQHSKILEWARHSQYRIFGGQFGRKPLENEWNGSDLKGKTIVVYSERDKGAFGDTFFATPLLRWLKECGATVVFVPQKLLRKLYSTGIQKTYVDQVLVRGEELPVHDFSTYLWSLFKGFYKEHGESSFPVERGWLSGRKELSPWIQKKLKPHVGKLLIGFWYRSSGPTSKGADYRVLDRDPGANRMVNTLRMPGVTLVCLEGLGHRPVKHDEFEDRKQKGTLGNLDLVDVTEDDSSEVVTFDPTKFDRENGAFVDTISVMEYVRKKGGLLVGCDTGLLNMAAAVVGPDSDRSSVLVVLNEKADMRWGTKKGKRRWLYSDNVEVFQGSEQGKWKEPLQQVREEVEARVKELAAATIK
ncbi:MAG TPA: hypothetical protein ENI08_01260 [Candidatus Dependentiae bacterium]|nr:hypothetical protein [Candidatus Dependentiae bacterium]